MPVIGTPIETVTPLPIGGVAPSCDLPATPASDSAPIVKEPLVGSQNCQFNCEQVFGTIRVLPTIKHGTRVEWELHPQFRDPGPYEFQLQFGHTGTNDADDWEPVGAAAYDVYYMEDDTQRVFGKTQWSHYRICLTTATTTYFSRPVRTDETLAFRERRRWAAMVRAHLVLLKQEEGVEGYLLKQKLFGTPCDAGCIDYQTFEITNPQCPTCYGTGFTGGYYEPTPCVYAALSRKVSHNELDGAKLRGTIDDMLRVKATMLAIPQLFENDVWVDRTKDARWFINTIENLAEYRGVPIVLSVELRLAPYSHPVYDVEIENQVPAIA